jgi:DNA helicase-2/ATP-dependent DNA helicase PcrA
VLAALADAGTVTGVIGDIEQSIFSDFTGARPADFKHFQPAGQQTFYITSNRRSTQSILRVLNHIRQGSEQEHHKDDDDQQRDEVTPVILVASPKKAQRFLREQIDKRVQTLTRKNEMVRELAGAELPEKDYDGIWESLFEANQYRAEWLEATLEATRVALEEDQYGQGVRILYRGLRTKNGRVLKKVFSARGERKLSRIQRRRTAASLLPFLLSNHGEHHEMDGLEFYLDVRAKMEDFLPETPMVKPTRGSFKQLLESSSYEFLYTTTRLTSGKGKVKTIHKAKGEEYPVVLTYRGKREDDDQDATLSHLLDPSDTKTEERRVTYVAFSRAEDRLYICLEELSQQEEEDLNDLDIEIDIRRLHE